MKRAGNLWNRVVSFENLLAATRAAAAGKRMRPDVARFLLNEELEVVGLQRELVEQRYTPGSYRTFIVHEPKRRMISAAPFRDRVVHHAVTRVLEPVFDKRFSPHSYACRKGYGTHKAIAEARRAAHNYTFVLKCDISKFFASMDHEILKSALARVIKCEPTLRLAARIIDASNAQEEVLGYFPGDDLFTPIERRHGLPLGNQTSQFFANVYLNALDQFVERRLKPARYVRYVDDFLLFGDGRRQLIEMLGTIERFLTTLRVRVHAGKSRVYRTSEGLTFLGWRIFADRLRLVRGNVVRFRRRLRTMQKRYTRGRVRLDDVTASVRAWVAHASHLRELINNPALAEHNEYHSRN